MTLKYQTSRHLTTSNYNKFTKEILETNIWKDKLFNESGLNEKIKTLATKEEIKKNISNKSIIKSRIR